MGPTNAWMSVKEDETIGRGPETARAKSGIGQHQVSSWASG